ncbi:MAG: septum site-determining protein MinC [Lachnospiraceae bacterium]|nr:septum site-determining protein MinC [Lachnospiraceae bacterium]
MKEKVRLKSFSSGIKIVIDDQATMDEVLSEIKEKFKESEKFFGKAKLAVTFEGRKNTEEEENAILDVIRETSSVNIVCVVSGESDEVFDRAVGRVQELLEGDCAQFFKGNLTGKNVLETEQSVIVLGHVEKGSCIISKKDIIVLGKLEGSAYAGADGKPHFVAALSMNPESLRIGEYKGINKGKGLWGRKKQTAPQMAYLKGEEIVFDDLTNTEELLQFLSE